MSFLPPLNPWTIVGIVLLVASTALLAFSGKEDRRKIVVGVVLALLGMLCTYIGPALDAREESKKAEQQLAEATGRLGASLAETKAQMDELSAQINATVKGEIGKSNDVAARAALEELQKKIVRLTQGLPPWVSDTSGGEGSPPSPPAPTPRPTPAPQPEAKRGGVFAYEVRSATIGKESKGPLPYVTLEFSIHNRNDEPVRVLAARNGFTIRTDGGPNFVPSQRDWGLSQCPSTHVPYCKSDDRADPLYIDIGPNAVERFNLTLHTSTRPSVSDMKVLAQLASGSLSGSLYAKYPNRKAGAVETLPVSVSGIAFRNSL